jgi:hypothetical protein
MAAEPASSAASFVGKTFGGYRIGELLGSGGSGAVYSAEPTAGGAKVALRIFHVDLARDKTAAARLVGELQKASGVQHPGLVPIREVSAIDYKGKRLLYVAMALLEGESLKARLGRLAAKQQTLPLAKVLHIASAVGAALQAIHRTGGTHRQLSAGAIFLARPPAGRPTADEQVILLDLGTAIVPAGDSAQLTVKSSKGGKIHDDIRSLALLVQELLSGAGDSVAGGNQAVLPLHFRQPQIPARLDAVLRSGIGDSLGSGDGSSRYESVAAFVAALLGTGDALPAIGLWSEDGQAPPRPTPSSSSGQLVWAAVLAVIVGALVSYWLYSTSSPALPPGPAERPPVAADPVVPVPVVTPLGPAAGRPGLPTPAAVPDAGVPAGHSGPWAPRLGKVPPLRAADVVPPAPTVPAAGPSPAPSVAHVPAAAPTDGAAAGSPSVPIAPGPVPTAKPPEPRSVPGAASPVPVPAPAGQKEVK